jgi:hypothetical protein
MCESSGNPGRSAPRLTGLVQSTSGDQEDSAEELRGELCLQTTQASYSEDEVDRQVEYSVAIYRTAFRSPRI